MLTHVLTGLLTHKPKQMISAFCTAFPRSLLILDDSTVFSVGQNCGDAVCPKCRSGSPNLHFEPGERLGACWGTQRPARQAKGEHVDTLFRASRRQEPGALCTMDFQMHEVPEIRRPKCAQTSLRRLDKIMQSMTLY